MEQRTAPAIGRGWGLVLVPCWWSWEAKASPDFPHDDVTQDNIYIRLLLLFFLNNDVPRAKKRGGGEYTEVCKLVSSLQKKRRRRVYRGL
jgi:hypothetical protein